jgi:3-dehydroquinate synthase
MLNKSEYGDLAANVVTKTSDYPVWVGWDIIGQLGHRIKNIIDAEISVAHIIADINVSDQIENVTESLESQNIKTNLYSMHSGESNKTLKTVSHIYEWLAGLRAERNHLIIAVGGGVTGDLAGFVASTYVRGMPFALIPTTLLSMMDASIGGKVGVDLPQGKNLVGSFYQPKFVLSDVKTLETLPKRELTSGWAEAIKHGLIVDKDLFSLFEENRDYISVLDSSIATDIIRKSVAIKANIVSRDEKETLGLRILLNYGHTIAHAIESTTGYTKYLHGEAVSIGMMAAAYISENMELLSSTEVARQKQILELYDLPVTAEDLNISDIQSAIKSDKKTSKGSINWVLLNGIGQAKTNNQVPTQYIFDALTKIIQ